MALNRQFDMPGNDSMQPGAVAEEESAGVVEAFTFSEDGRFVGGTDGDFATDQRVVGIVLAEERGEGCLGAADERGVEVAGEGDQRGVKVEGYLA